MISDITTTDVEAAPIAYPIFTVWLYSASDANCIGMLFCIMSASTAIGKPLVAEMITLGSTKRM